MKIVQKGCTNVDTKPATYAGEYAVQRGARFFARRRVYVRESHVVPRALTRSCVHENSMCCTHARF
jgi:hypothetical protein